MQSYIWIIPAVLKLTSKVLIAPTIVGIVAVLTSGASNGVTYTYQPAVTANPTNLKINGGEIYKGEEYEEDDDIGADIENNNDSRINIININGIQCSVTYIGELEE